MILSLSFSHLSFCVYVVTFFTHYNPDIVITSPHSDRYTIFVQKEFLAKLCYIIRGTTTTTTTTAQLVKAKLFMASIITWFEISRIEIDKLSWLSGHKEKRKQHQDRAKLFIVSRARFKNRRIEICFLSLKGHIKDIPLELVLLHFDCPFHWLLFVVQKS